MLTLGSHANEKAEVWRSLRDGDLVEPTEETQLDLT